MQLNLLRGYLQSADFERKLNQRLERLQLGEASPVERMNIWQECREDVFVFIELFGMVYEPRLPESPDIPLFLFPHQREVLYGLLRAEERGEDLLIEKTRDMMVTWTVLWYMLWRWLFKERWYGYLGSRKEEEVDDKTPQSLFGRLRYMLYALPVWMRPAGFRKSEHDNHMKLVNPDLQSFLDGESANPNFGRGGRYTFMFFDELFFWRFARESWRSASDSSPVRVAVSTAVPSSFARSLRETMEVNKTLMTLSWEQNPFKDQAWHDKEVARRSNDPLAIQGELGISYQADPNSAYYPSVNNSPIRDFDYTPELPLYISLDFGAQDKTAVEYWQRDAKNFFCLDAVEQNQRPLHWFLPFLLHGYDFERTDSYEVVNKFTKETYRLDKKMYYPAHLDLIRRFNAWRLPTMYCGEIAHRNRSQTVNSPVPMSIASILNGFGVFLRINNFGNDHQARRTAVIRMLTTTVFSSKYGAMDVYDALANAHYPPGRDNSTAVKVKDEPVHDETADLRAACENFAVNVIAENSKTRETVYARNPLQRQRGQ